MRLVIALGGNALIRRGERPDADTQQERTRALARALAPVASQHEVVLCHGNGPQVGVLALESAADLQLTRPFPLDTLVAETQGMIGYWLARGLRSEGSARPPIAMVTETLVARDDPAFGIPTKFIGPAYSAAEADEAERVRGWTFGRDGDRIRRTVPSPRAERTVEIDEVVLLLEAGRTVICGGGGGVPVIAEGPELRGIEAIVDKDDTAANLAIGIAADLLVILTDVPALVRGFGSADPQPITAISAQDAATLDLPPGSMGPKVRSCVEFVRATGRPARIGSLDEAAAVVEGTSGTTISP
jgi:carbamate kinase